MGGDEGLLIGPCKAQGKSLGKVLDLASLQVLLLTGASLALQTQPGIRGGGGLCA